MAAKLLRALESTPTNNTKQPPNRLERAPDRRNPGLIDGSAERKHQEGTHRIGFADEGFFFCQGSGGETGAVGKGRGKSGGLGLLM